MRRVVAITAVIIVVVLLDDLPFSRAYIHAGNNWISSRARVALSKRRSSAFETKCVHGPSCLITLLPITCNEKCLYVKVIVTLPYVLFCLGNRISFTVESFYRVT
jgi:hypothetical protein